MRTKSIYVVLSQLSESFLSSGLFFLVEHSKFLLKRALNFVIRGNGICVRARCICLHCLLLIAPRKLVLLQQMQLYEDILCNKRLNLLVERKESLKITAHQCLIILKYDPIACLEQYCCCDLLKPRTIQ